MKTITEIQNVQEICDLAVSGFTDWKTFGDVSVSENEDLLIFNYTAKAQYERRWNYFERVCRGLIINKMTGEIVARAFDKFYNWMEEGRKSEASIVSITEKMDGSLGILYRQNGEYKIATRGSFNSDQAVWATRFLKKKDLSELPPEYTMLFEIIYPENRVVVDYGEMECLVLLAVRNRFTGDYLPFEMVESLAKQYDFLYPYKFKLQNVEDILRYLPELPVYIEGYVVEFSDGQRFKFKGHKYLELHKLISGLSFKNTLAAVASGTVDQIRTRIPEEFLDQFNSWLREIDNTTINIISDVYIALAAAPKENRKEFAIWVNANHKHLAHYLFAALDDKDIVPMIYKKAFENRRDEKVMEKTENNS